MNRYYMHGPVYGIVTANEDPDKLGRVKVKLDFLGNDVETPWITTVTPVGGVMIVPEINDQVVVAFMGDCSDHPVVMGCLWSTSQLPPETGENTGSDLNQDGENNLKFMKTRGGNMLIFDDKEGEEKIQGIASGGNTRYEFSAKDEYTKLGTDTDILISSKKGITVSAENVTITAKETIALEGEQVSIVSKSKNATVASAQKGIDVEGSSVKLN